MSFALTHQWELAVTVAALIGTGVLGYRLLSRQPPWRAVGALVIVGLGAFLAGSSGEASDFLLPPVIIRASGLVISVILILVRLPLSGLAMGWIAKEGLHWRRCPTRLRAHTSAGLVIESPTCRPPGHPPPPSSPTPAAAGPPR